LGVVFFRDWEYGYGTKIAVRTLTYTEGDMDIYSYIFPPFSYLHLSVLLQQCGGGETTVNLCPDLLIAFPTL